jgi:predicted RNA-binding Zn ribbon-like protein
MTTALQRACYIKKLEWAISLSQQKLPDLREGDWLNLRDELYEFLNTQEEKRSFFGKVTQESIAAIQRELKTKFDQCADMGAGWEKSGLKSGVSGINFGVTKAAVHLIATAPDLLFQQSIRCDDLKTEVLLELANILAVSGVAINQIRRCPNADCNRLFLLRMKPRTDRNFYCSPRCSGLAATRKYRREKAEELRAKDRGRYEKKQKQKFPGARVGRGKL